MGRREKDGRGKTFPLIRQSEFVLFALHKRRATIQNIVGKNKNVVRFKELHSMQVASHLVLLYNNPHLDIFTGSVPQ